MDVHPDLLAVLRCPDSGAPLVADEGFLVSTDPATRRRYRAPDGIPDMIIEESEVLEEAAWIAIMENHGVRPGEGGSGE